MSFLGIDIGSSQVKAVAFDESGRRLAAAYRKYDYSIPQAGWMELDGNTVISAALETIAECAKAVKETSPVRALACSSQGEAFSPVDAMGNILSPAMISGDSRASQTIADFAKQFGRERLYNLTGHSSSAMFSIAKLLWLKENMPDVFRDSAYFLCFEDLLAFRLTGNATIGWPLAARTMLFNPATHKWEHELLKACGISETQLAQPMPSGTLAGGLYQEMCSRLHLSKDAVWVTGGHDQVIGAYGCGVREAGTAMCAAGSVECLVPVMDHLAISTELFNSNLCSYDFATPGNYASVAYSLTGSNLTEYFLREIVQDTKKDYARLMSEMPQGPTNLLVVPYFTPSGTPYFDEITPASVYGWRFGTSRGELFKGLTEGVAFEMRLNCELLKKNGFKLDRLIATGGGFRSPAMVQLYADVFGVPISVCNETEAGCRGAASLAAQASENISLPKPEIVSVVQPDDTLKAAYTEKFGKWKLFSQNIRDFAKCIS